MIHTGDYGVIHTYKFHAIFHSYGNCAANWYDNSR